MKNVQVLLLLMILSVFGAYAIPSPIDETHDDTNRVRSTLWGLFHELVFRRVKPTQVLIHLVQL